MRRRDFITLLGSAAAAWPVTARGQQVERMRQLAVMMTAPPSDQATQQRLAGFQRRLAELGWAEGRDVRFDRRFTGGTGERIRADVGDVVRLRPDVILAQ